MKLEEFPEIKHGSFVEIGRKYRGIVVPVEEQEPTLELFYVAKIVADLKIGSGASLIIYSSRRGEIFLGLDLIDIEDIVSYKLLDYKNSG